VHCRQPRKNAVSRNSNVA
jgi:hypothetical protein